MKILMLLTALAMRTARLRLGSAVMVLPWHNPVLLAEEAATLDAARRQHVKMRLGKVMTDDPAEMNRPAKHAGSQRCIACTTGGRATRGR